MLDNIQLVKFENGKWGVRKGWVFYSYKQLNIWNNWWHARDNTDYKHCQGTEEQAKDAYAQLMDSGEPNEYN
jgi:hypothetical protein